MIDFCHRFIKLVTREDIVRSVFTLATGTIISQGLTIIAAPLLTRIYTPEEFGVAALYFSVVSILSPVVCGNYDMAVVLPEKDEDAANLMVLSVILSLIISGLTLICWLVFSQQLASLLGLPNSIMWDWLIPVSLLISGLYSVFSYWVIRQKKFSQLATANVSQYTTTFGYQFGLGLLQESGWSELVKGKLVGSVIATGLLGHVVIKDWVDSKYKLSKQLILSMMVRYRKYPIFTVCPNLLNSFTAQFPVLFLSHFFDSTVVGQYSLSMRLLILPTALIGNAISKAYHQKFAEQRLKGNLSESFQEAFIILGCFSIIFFSLVIVLSPTLFSVVFGVEWKTAGIYSQILAPALAVRFVVSALSIVCGVCDRQELSAAWKVIFTITTIIVLPITLIFKNPIYSILGLCLKDIVMYLLYLYLIDRVAEVNLFRMVKSKEK